MDAGGGDGHKTRLVRHEKRVQGKEACSAREKGTGKGSLFGMRKGYRERKLVRHEKRVQGKEAGANCGLCGFECGLASHGTCVAPKGHSKKAGISQADEENRQPGLSTAVAASLLCAPPPATAAYTFIAYLRLFEQGRIPAVYIRHCPF
eukprot:356781-Chlamydomonas_euryale.AAC.13